MDALNDKIAKLRHGINVFNTTTKLEGFDFTVDESLVRMAMLTEKKNRLSRMKGVPDEERTARFVCAIAAVFPDGEKEVVRGTMEGRVAYEIAGANGFGYDPIFYLPEYGCTSAELSPEKKNELSHRGQGLRMMRKIMEKKLQQ